MGTKFTYALILTAIGAAFRLLLFFTGFETEKLATGQYFQWALLPVVFVVYWLALKAVREERPHQALSYGQGVGTGAVISLMSGAMSAVYTFIHLKFINTSFVDYQLEIIRAQWAKSGMSDTQMEQAEKFTRMLMSPGISSGIALFLGFLFGLIVVLIVAAFVKRAAPAVPGGVTA
ncbi:MAG: DUF4199 domain-containing protein [Opitutae bacterium]|nr:DUF4199 domain-containing protein [Opitutae bacterium]